MCRANEAIVRERLPIPTVDEVLESLNGSTVFSKLDLRWGFHQIELKPNSRDITAFAMMEFSDTSDWALVSMQPRRSIGISPPRQWQVLRA